MAVEGLNNGNNVISIGLRLGLAQFVGEKPSGALERTPKRR
jgi:hypothetical protein